MKVTIQELDFIKTNAPRNLAALISETLGVTRNKVHYELKSVKGDYDAEIINEAFRLIKAIKGVEFKA